jgi:acetyl/propionyl-CoA carboxylase alpha subunit
MRRRFEIDGTAIDAALMRRAEGYALDVGGDVQPVDLSPPAPDGTQILRVGDRAFPVHVAREGDETFVQIAGRSFTIRTIEPLTVFAHAGGANADLTARAPMPGTVVSVRVQAGARVGKGETMMVIESMKLETAITAWRDGTVAAVHLAAGQTFDRDTPLVSLVAEAPE